MTLSLLTVEGAERSFPLAAYTEIPYICSVQTVIETPSFLASARDEGLDDEDRSVIVTYIARNPDAGDLIPGTGGARKIRFAGRGKGKSGGYRVVTFYAGADVPVFLLDVYGKDTRANLSRAERNELRKLLTTLPQAWRENVAKRTKPREDR